MNKRRYIFLIVLIVPILIGSKIAIGGMGGVYGSHMMDDEMMEEPPMKMPGMMMPKMGKEMMKKGMPPMPMPMSPWEHLKERLDLTDEQAVKLRKVYIDYRKEVLRKGADMEIAEMDLAELLKNKGASEKAVEDAVNKLASLRSSLDMFRVKALLKTRDFLSDEQYEDLTNFIFRWRRPYRWAWPREHGWDD